MSSDHDPSFSTDDEDAPLHVFDLPQLYQKPSAAALLETLKSLATTTTSWDPEQTASTTRTRAIDPTGIPEYLTRIVASPLHWITDEDAQDAVRDAASQRLTERSGRTGMGALTRDFAVPLSATSDMRIRIHEPALTADNLGLKTWGAAYVLARRLHTLDLPGAQQRTYSPTAAASPPRVLELGAGTGLAGLAAAAAWRTHVLLTDLPAIAPNLARNAALNRAALAAAGAAASTAVLDWSDPDAPVDARDAAGQTTTLRPAEHSADVILAADPLYDASHPALLAAAICRWLPAERDGRARIAAAYPLRAADAGLVAELKRRLRDEAGAALLEERREAGVDDWRDGVTVEWAVWAR